MKKNKVFLAVLTAIMVTVACTKIITTDIGVGDLIPPVDGVTVKDTTLDVIANTFGNTTTSVRLEDGNILGIYEDPVFGKTTGDVYMQIQPTSFPFRFPVRVDSITAIDSVVLILQTNGVVYGDTTTNAGFRVYQINDATFTRSNGYPFDISKSFTVNNELSYNNAEIFVNPLVVNDTIKAYGDTTGTVNQMRLKLKNSLAQTLMNIDTASYRNDTLFRQVFHGLKIQSTSGNSLIPALPYGSRLAMYYKYTSRRDGSADTAVTYFTSNISTSASANNITNNYSGTSLTSLPLGDTTTGNEFIHVQSAPGIYSRIKIPGLSNLSKMFIYRAELIMDEIPATTTNLFKPNLFISGIENNRRILLKDVAIAPKTVGYVSINEYYTSNLRQYGSYPILKRDSINNLNYYQYNFKLTAHVQDIIKGITPNYNMEVFVPFRDSVYSNALSRYVHVQGSSTSGSYYNINYPVIQRGKIYGNNTNSSHKMRLHIVYSPVQ